jgi:catechol 2,3-dioxygenase-like lactoylglutathione lyase family enzyme
MRPVQPSVVAVQRHVMLSAVPTSGTVNSVIRITGIGDRDRPEWLIRISGMRSMKKVYDGNNFVYHVGGRTALGIQRCAEAYENERFVQNRIGLHHLCLRARSRDDVDKAAKKLRDMGARIDRGPVDREWAEGYYFFVFEDPDGIRLEINHVPGKGLLTEGGRQNPSDDPNWNQNP